jgi:hypothetical protein
MIPPKVYELCQNNTTLTAELTKNPSEPPASVCKRLFHVDTDDNIIRDKAKHTPTSNATDVEQARQCGKWGDSQPSELFLKVGNKSSRSKRKLC